jgi:Acetyltransferase (isoleucine patch superfamily)
MKEAVLFMTNKLRDSSKLTFHNRLCRVADKLHLLKTFIFYKGFFKKTGKKFLLIKPLKLSNPHHITIGNNVSIYHLGWLLTQQVNEELPQLIIDDGVCIGHFCHITCVNKVHIGKNVLIADRLYISDNLHGYEDINTPIVYQKVICKGEVMIGDDSWIGENVCIIGCKIGKHCVIGANAVVTKDIPDYSVAAGIPARVIKRYNQQTQKWEKVS